MYELLIKILILIVFVILAVKTPLGGIIVAIATFIVRARLILAILALVVIMALIVYAGAGA
jgi:hypothetical protein